MTDRQDRPPVSPLPASEFDRRMADQPLEQVWREYYEPESAGRMRRQGVLRQALAPRAGERILDVGCGAGGLAYWAARQGAQVIGMDYSFASLRAGMRVAAARPGPAPRYVQADATRLPIRDGSLDAAICVDVLDVLPADRHAGLVSELLRVVRPGGRVILYTPNGRREAIGRAIRPIRRLLGGWRQPVCPLHIGLAGPSRICRLLRERGVRGRLILTDMNYPWLAAMPLLRGWLSGHMLWRIDRPAP